MSPVTRPIWKEYVENALNQVQEQLRVMPTYLLNVVNDGKVPVKVIVNLPSLPLGLDSEAIARSLIKHELLRRNQAAEWNRAKLAALTIVAAAAVTAAFAAIG